MRVRLPRAVAFAVLAGSLAVAFASRSAAQVDTMASAAAADTTAAPLAVASAPSDSLRDPWSQGRNWLMFRAGYAKSNAVGAANGSFGGGIGFRHMLTKRKLYRWTLFKQFSLGGFVHFEHLGQFGPATEFEIPVTLELVRHFRWSTYLWPYMGFGGGGAHRKLYRTGADIGVFKPVYYLVFGAEAPLTGRQVLGVDARAIRADALNDPTNPVFGSGDKTATHWSIKLDYGLTY